MLRASVSCRDHVLKNRWVGRTSSATRPIEAGSRMSALTLRTPSVSMPCFRETPTTSQPDAASLSQVLRPVMPVAPITSAVRSAMGRIPLGGLEELECHAVGVGEVDEVAALQWPVLDEQRRSQELDALGTQVVVDRLQVRNVDAHMGAPDVGVRAVECVLPLVVVAEQLHHRAAETQHGEPELGVGHPDGPREVGPGTVRDELRLDAEDLLVPAQGRLEVADSD